MASSCSGRRCFHFVSKVGPTSPSRSQPSTSDHASDKWNAATIAVVLSAAVALVAMVALAIVLRRRRIREQAAMRGDVAGDDGAVGKAGGGEGGVSEGDPWSAQGTVELVVMAGETKPTYLATPTIQCPPLILAKGEDHP